LILANANPNFFTKELIMKSLIVVVFGLVYASSAFAGYDGPCAETLRAAAAAKTRASSFFKHYGDFVHEQAQVRGIDIDQGEDGLFQVTVIVGISQEDDGETGSTSMIITTDDKCGDLHISGFSDSSSND
jgi:hypothetical protein